MWCLPAFVLVWMENNPYWNPFCYWCFVCVIICRPRYVLGIGFFGWCTLVWTLGMSLTQLMACGRRITQLTSIRIYILLIEMTSNQQWANHSTLKKSSIRLLCGSYFTIQSKLCWNSEYRGLYILYMYICTWHCTQHKQVPRSNSAIVAGADSYQTEIGATVQIGKRISIHNLYIRVMERSL